MRLGWEITYAVVGLALGIPLHHLCGLIGDRTCQRVLTVQMAIAVSPLVLHPWTPWWYANAASDVILTSGAGNCMVSLVRRRRRRKEEPDV